MIKKIQRLRRSIDALSRAAAGHFPALVRRAGKILSILSILSEGFSVFLLSAMSYQLLLPVSHEL
jgi:hypothetical protein